MSFSSLGLSPSLLKTLAAQKYEYPYPIQLKAIPLILKKADVLGIAKTGSGKTASYVLPILRNLQRSRDTKNRHVNVLVLVPTRELAEQVKNVFQKFGSVIPERIKTLAVYGGVSINPQMKALQGVNIVVATPGRLLELVESNAVHLSEISTLVLDEADRMLAMGFKEEMDRIYALLPARRQNLLFSATLNEAVSQEKELLLNNPEVIKIEDDDDKVDLIEQVAYYASDEKKGPLLRYIIKSKELKQVLVFVSSAFKADSVVSKLSNNGIRATAIHGKKSQGARTKALERFKSGQIEVLVTTDLLARGVDIDVLPCVINYELPRSPKDYIHRIGRTGRAESEGIAISLVSPDEAHHFKVIQKKMGKWVDRIDGDSINLHGY
ncbi:DEAD/DEAH box helicase [Carboxylicivirga marina]|uniref:DEAD/DEAH box helicase n=1 Tax=Carboxylicivirga marina TaxID=2800988 RepID=A0ABS1HJW4_9BACT|nr:DEAD/DEAH box helicase [Carboxylicivirga marina]MBK3517755.1 DEAD/DEAH box helicase [Carboxylicivirga marina]